MKTAQLLIASAVAAALAMPLASSAQSGPAPKPKFQAEKCYGIVKAGKNDCQTANSSCAGTSKRDNQGDAWIYMPAGSCEKLVGKPAGQRALKRCAIGSATARHARPAAGLRAQRSLAKASAATNGSRAPGTVSRAAAIGAKNSGWRSARSASAPGAACQASRIW